MKKKPTKKQQAAQAEAAKQAIVSAAEKMAQRTRNIHEFVVQVDMGFDAPMINTGIVVLQNVSNVVTPYIILNRLEKQPFFTAQQCIDIEAAINRNNAKTIKDIASICPTASVIPCFPGLPITMLKDPIQGSALMGMFMFADYMSSPLSRLAGSKTDVRYMAANTHVYFNDFPAGLGIGTTIDVVQCHIIPHLANKVYSKFFGFEAGTSRPIIATEQDGHRINIATDPKFLSFKNLATDESSHIATNVFDLMVLFEKLNDTINGLKAKPKAKKRK